MNLAKIQKILELAPSKISFYTENEIKEFQFKEAFHEQYRRERARRYLELKAKGETTEKEREYLLDCNSILTALKDKELIAEINFRGWRMKRDRADDTLQATMELARLARKEMGSLDPTVK